MIREITIGEFVKEFSEKVYIQLAKDTYAALRKDEKFLNKEPYVCVLIAFDFLQSGKKQTIIIEADAHKMPIVKGITAYNFGITKISISDEDMPDEFLDRYNEFKKN